MSPETKVGFVKIIRIPDGEAPEWVRKAWLGLVLECASLMQVPTGPEVGVLTNSPVKEAIGCCITGRYGVSVPQAKALSVLEERDPLAAAWWRYHGYPITTPGQDHFGFAQEEVEIVSGVTRGTLLELTDEMMGDPYR